MNDLASLTLEAVLLNLSLQKKGLIRIAPQGFLGQSKRLPGPLMAYEGPMYFIAFNLKADLRL